MRALKSLFFLYLFSVVHLQITAQVRESYSPAKIIPPSPNAASLGIYGNLPVSYYSGIPNISIPIYDLKTTNHSVPITLSYNSGGTKVGENASWVGLGWSLSAGGVITRTIIGLDDLASGYHLSENLPPNRTPMTNEDKAYFYNILSGYEDGDPDVFSYNFGKYSGKFMLGKIKNGSKVYMDEQNNLRIEYSTFKWNVTTPDGYKYYFGQQERAIDYYNSSSNTEIDDRAPLSAYTREIKADAVTAWYLDSIVAPNAELVKFEYYTGSRTSLSITNKSESMYNALQYVGGCVNNTVDLPALTTLFTANKQVIYDVNLKRISFSQGTIDFVTTDRSDVEYTGNLLPQKLSEVVIKNLAGIQISRYLFSYSYFMPNTLDSRLKLDRVTEFGATDKNKPPYVFTYFNPGNLPPKYSKSIDHWNYFNGKLNTSLLPAMFVGDRSFSGGNRQPDSVSVYPKNGVLSKIVYPTGASTDFDYELHDYSNPTGDDQYAKLGKGIEVNARPGFEFINQSKTFTIAQRDTVVATLSYGYRKADENANSLNGIQTVFVYLTFPDGHIESWDNWPCPGQPDPTCGMSDGSSQFREKVLFPGTYRLEVRYLQGYSTSANLNWEERIKINQRKGGGIRIKSIIDRDKGSITNYRKYLYTSDGRTTGKLISQPRYHIRVVIGSSGNVSGCAVVADYFGRTSRSNYTYGLTTKGAAVGYEKVTEIFGENGEGGKAEHFYHNQADLLSTIPMAPTYGYPLNGRLSLDLIYNVRGKILKKTEYQYITKETAYLTGVKIFTPTTVAGPANFLTYDVNYYENPSSWNVLSSKIESEYDESENPFSSQTENYFYENSLHKEISRKSVLTNNGFTTYNYKFPQDLTGAIPNALISKGQIGTILQESQSKNAASQITSTDYFIPDGTSVILPKVVKSYSSVDSIEEVRLRYHLYDRRGNILSVSKEYGAKNNYLWSYNGQLPIASISNAEYSTIENILGGKAAVENFSNLSNPTPEAVLNFLTPLRNAVNLSSSEVNTYTYAPLVGIKSQTDAKGLSIFYDYDEFNRLKFIRDQYRNIIKSYDYNYGQIITYKSSAINKSFIKSDCPSGQGTSVIYTLAEGAFTSTVSLDDANSKAQSFVDINGPINANLHGDCTVVTPPVIPCDGPDKKVINNVCQTGIRVNTSSSHISGNNYRCTYHYEWSDGSSSVNYTENNTAPCAID